ncbi:roadblock/LC7 domain-containing protein [Kibdelosporangium philippinense]|uniref:Roadblock/LC7 domain-containing protein n=1 Tax=Kibdelosporangium philippinense TaxID=211113 RepID=A0ABS8ZA59_9PSEU|nr:roadblock/LC7 domain-containing protein [Kibdelosporangium philippinense]MCE7003566.1 roadblock/LC7 domain-containing protein [Kibdelosporangium philippinense]
MTETPTKGRQVSRFGWLVDNFTERVAGVAHAIVISVDGLLLTASNRLPHDRADQMAAISAGIHSLNQGAAKVLGAQTVNRAIVEMDYGVLLLTSIKDGSCLAVLARRDSDIAQIAYEMTVLVDQVGQMLTPELRAELSGSVRR